MGRRGRGDPPGHPFLMYARETYPDLLISLDTWRAEVAAAAPDGVVDIVNDTWAGADPELVHCAAERGAAIVCSHSGGLPPRTDPIAITYGDDPLDVVRHVLRTLADGAERALAAGIPPERILVDPTLDFGKTTRHSLTVLRHTADVTALGFPVLQALSRKDFIGESLDLPADDRLEGTLAATAVAAWLGATVFRAHDVRATRRVIDMVAVIRGDRPPALSVRGSRPGRRPRGRVRPVLSWRVRRRVRVRVRWRAGECSRGDRGCVLVGRARSGGEANLTVHRSKGDIGVGTW